MRTEELISWDEFKALCVVQKNLTLQYRDKDAFYEIWAVDASTTYQISLTKSTPEATDFENNYQADSNWAAGLRPYAFATGDFEFKGDGVIATIPLAATSYNIDYQVASPLYINGGMAFVDGSILGDYITASVYDKDGVVPEAYRAAYPEWPIIKPWVVKWYLPQAPAGGDTPPILIQTAYAGLVPAGFYMRITYFKNIGYSPKIALNYFFHKAI